MQLYTLDYRTQEHTGRRGQTQRDRARDTTYIVGQIIVKPWPLCDQCIIVVVVWVRAVENTGLHTAKFVKQKGGKNMEKKNKIKVLYLWSLLWWESNELKTKDTTQFVKLKGGHIHIIVVVFFNQLFPCFQSEFNTDDSTLCLFFFFFKGEWGGGGAKHKQSRIHPETLY